MKSISVLCRGESLKAIKHLPKSDIVILANRFGEEIENVPGVKEYLDDAEIYLCTSGTGGELDSLKRIDFFEKYNPTKMIRPYLGEISSNIRLHNSCNLPNTFLSEAHKEYMVPMKYPYDYSTTGIAAIGYAVLESECDTINIIGLDFYENSAYTTSQQLNLEEIYKTDPWIKDGNMEKFFIKFVKNNPNKQFNIITTAKTHLNELITLANVNYYIIDF